MNPPETAEDAAKPKTAYLVLVDKYGLEVSYETFKLYAKEIGPAAQRNRAPTMLELPPGAETQIDYGGVGSVLDQRRGTNRRVYAFAAKLFCSRLPYIQFVYTQNSESFAQSNIGMVEFYSGVTERLIPQARELFRRLKALHPTFTLEQLIRAALEWCREEYGMTKHGRTGIEPMVLFEEEGKQALKPLPSVRFEVPVYKPVKVHADRFFIFEKNRYAMPERCRGQSFIARRSGGILRVFDTSYRLLRSYPITGLRVSWLPGDLAESQEALINGTYPRYLLSRARALGAEAEALVAAILRPHAWVKARHARGMLSVLEQYRSSPFLPEVCSQALDDRVFTPKQIKTMLEHERRQRRLELVPPMSDAGRAMTRDIHEYLNGRNTTWT